MEKMNQHKRMAGDGRVPGKPTTTKHFANGGCAGRAPGKSTTPKRFANGGAAGRRGKSTPKPW